MPAESPSRTRQLADRTVDCGRPKPQRVVRHVRNTQVWAEPQPRAVARLATRPPHARAGARPVMELFGDLEDPGAAPRQPHTTSSRGRLLLAFRTARAAIGAARFAVASLGADLAAAPAADFGAVREAEAALDALYRAIGRMGRHSLGTKRPAAAPSTASDVGSRSARDGQSTPPSKRGRPADAVEEPVELRRGTPPTSPVGECVICLLPLSDPSIARDDGALGNPLFVLPCCKVPCHQECAQRLAGMRCSRQRCPGCHAEIDGDTREQLAEAERASVKSSKALATALRKGIDAL